MTGPIRVLVAEDHALVRAGFCALLRTLDDVQLVAEAGDGREALELIQGARPDVVLVDISMPGLNGLELTRRLALEQPEVRVLILSVHSGEEYVLRALDAGAAGYLVKDSGIAELALAVRAVAAGRTYLSPRVSRHVIEAYLARRPRATAEPFDLLTGRQREILQLIAEGRTTKEIAQQLDLSVKTVDTHRTQLMDRLDIHDIAGLVRYAVRIGLVSAER